jgi:hypothetical protein
MVCDPYLEAHGITVFSTGVDFDREMLTVEVAAADEDKASAVVHARYGDRVEIEVVAPSAFIVEDVAWECWTPGRARRETTPSATRLSAPDPRRRVGRHRADRVRLRRSRSGRHRAGLRRAGLPRAERGRQPLAPPHSVAAAKPSDDGGVDTVVWIALGAAALAVAGGIGFAGAKRVRIGRQGQLA